MSRFTDSVDVYLKGFDFVSTGACPGCVDCGLEDMSEMPDTSDEESRFELASEPGFSWSACDGCGSTFGGHRYPAHGRSEEDDSLVHFRVCTDCVLYLANGDEPEDWRQHPGQ